LRKKVKKKQKGGPEGGGRQPKRNFRKKVKKESTELRFVRKKKQQGNQSNDMYFTICAHSGNSKDWEREIAASNARG